MIPTDWHKTVNRLKREMPTDLPVTVRTAKRIKDCHGWCDKRNGRYLVVIEQAEPYVMFMVLCHEYAHLFDWHNGIKEHSESWGCWFARAYQVVFETE